ncbi:MAG: NAD-dependent DNA ligase LigA [Lachnospiraceae bacterium]|nr:NAD-dependent DNA ligase LigA [Lachnospiraceae bacterium]
MTGQSNMERQKELTERLSEASRTYYAEDREIMSNFEYDRLCDELKRLEEENGLVMAGSPTESVGYEPVEYLPKERHASPMLSLGKTKSREELKEWLGDRDGLLSWKEDGLTVVVTYDEGKLVKAVTRGNGEVGEVITPNARTFKNIPLVIPYKGLLVVRGEAIISYSDFEKINSQEMAADQLYKNPRNLCSGSVRALDPAVAARRNIQLIAFALVSAADHTASGDVSHDFGNSFEKQFVFLKEQGFTVVEYRKVKADTIVREIEYFEKAIKDNDIPSDGLVLSYDDLAYAESLGRTAKFPRGAIAFKWADETAETVLRKVEWQTSRTGMINPIAVFDCVDLEGTEVRRASLHNVSVIKELKLGIGDRITVYKANMIIPQISENLTKSDSLEIPSVCPVCGAPSKIVRQVDSEVLTCTGSECPAKKLRSFVHFVERDAMNIEGLSEATLEKLIGAGLLHEFRDIYNLRDKSDEILSLEGFKEKSRANLIESIEKSRKTTVPRLIYAMGIPGVGAAVAKLISGHFSHSLEAMKKAGPEELSEIEGVGEVLAGAFCSYMQNDDFVIQLDALAEELEFESADNGSSDNSLAGLTFVITGSLMHFGNRSDLKNLIEAHGGKVSGSVSKKTECLINNDAASTSSKNKTAIANGVKILTEDDFLSKYLPDFTV